MQAFNIRHALVFLFAFSALAESGFASDAPRCAPAPIANNELFLRRTMSAWVARDEYAGQQLTNSKLWVSTDIILRRALETKLTSIKTIKKRSIGPVKKAQMASVWWKRNRLHRRSGCEYFMYFADGYCI